jgi:shikimate dehydrogenase
LTRRLPRSARSTRLSRGLAGYRGYNTDLPGLKKAVKVAGIDLKDSDVILIGAGGAAKAVACLCASSGIKSLTVLDRTPEKAGTISGYGHCEFPGYPD